MRNDDLNNFLPLAEHATGSGNVYTEGSYPDKEALIYADFNPEIPLFQVITSNNTWWQTTVHYWVSPTLLSSLPPTRLSTDNPPITPGPANDLPGTPISTNPPATGGGNPTLNAMVPRLRHANQDLNNPQQQTEDTLELLAGPKSETLRQPDDCLSTRRIQRSIALNPKLYACPIPGCKLHFRRSDFRGNHLRKKHGLPIPKGCWAKVWITKAENHKYFMEAAKEQARANSILSQKEK